MSATHPHFGRLWLADAFIGTPERVLGGREIERIVHAEFPPLARVETHGFDPELMVMLDRFVPLDRALEATAPVARAAIGARLHDSPALAGWLAARWNDPAFAAALRPLAPAGAGPEGVDGAAFAGALAPVGVLFGLSPTGAGVCDGPPYAALDFQLSGLEETDAPVLTATVGPDGAVIDVTAGD